MPVRDRELFFRFWRKVLIDDGCWEWQGSLNRQGYGRLHVRTGYRPLAHRLAWELWHGEDMPPYPTVVCHRCDNPKCVRPDHLFVGTQADNIHDASAKGRLSPPPPAQSHEMCRRGHAFADHAVARPQGGRLCGVCLAEAQERRKHPCARCGLPCSKVSRICQACYAEQRRKA